MADSINGSTRQKNGNWYYRIQYYDEFGNRKFIERKGGKNKTETNLLLSKKIKELENGTSLKNIKLCTIFAEFISDCENKNRKSTTINRYRGLFNNHLTVLADKNINDIKAYQIKQLFDNLECSDTTKQITFDLLKLLYKYAYKLCYIDSISTIDRLDRPQRTKKELNNISFDELEKIFVSLKCNDDYRSLLLYNFIYLSVELGTRRGELCGLTWDCVNFDDSSVYIKYNLVYDNGKTYISEPKTVNGYRKIYLSCTSVKILKDLRFINNKNKILLGADYIKTC